MTATVGHQFNPPILDNDFAGGSHLASCQQARVMKTAETLEPRCIEVPVLVHHEDSAPTIVGPKR